MFWEEYPIVFDKKAFSREDFFRPFLRWKMTLLTLLRFPLKSALLFEKRRFYWEEPIDCPCFAEMCIF